MSLKIDELGLSIGLFRDFGPQNSNMNTKWRLFNIKVFSKATLFFETSTEEFKADVFEKYKTEHRDWSILKVFMPHSAYQHFKSALYENFYDNLYQIVRFELKNH